jgi:hypothetical protein
MADVHLATDGGPGVVDGGAYGAWTHHEISEDRSGWHPLVWRFYEYWLSIAPPGRLPARQHVLPEELVSLWPWLWMLDVYRDPLRFRYRLVGTEITRSVHREMTGQWLDEAQPEAVANPMHTTVTALSLRPVARPGGMARSIGSEIQNSASSKTTWCRWRPMA